MPAAAGTTAFIFSPNLLCVGVDQMASRWPQVQAEDPCWYRGGTSEWSVLVLGGTSETTVRVHVCLLETTKLDQPASGRPMEQVRVPGMQAGVAVRQSMLMLERSANVCVCVCV